MLYIGLFKATKNLKLVSLNKDNYNLDLEEHLVVQGRESLKRLNKLIIDHQVELMIHKIQTQIQIEDSKPFKVRVYVLVEKLLNN